MSDSSTRAILIERHGPPHVLVERTVPLREPGPRDVHLKVHASGVNFADLLMRAGLYGTVPRRPYSPGFEVAGRIVRVGSDVSDWREGDAAVALTRYGGYARDLVLRSGQLFRYPEPLTAVQAATIPVAFLTAWVALFEAARARSGETALILGAAGGCGSAAVQLAAKHGLRVIGTAGTAGKRAFVKDDLRAAACFDSRSDWEDGVRRLVGDRGIDIALDSVGGASTTACRRLLAPFGRLVFYGLSDAMPRSRRNWLSAGLAWLKTHPLHPLSLIPQNIGVFGIHLLHLQSKQSVLKPAMQEIFDAIGAGQLHPVLDRTFPLDRFGAVEAHRYLHARRNIGKVVLENEQAET